MSEKDGIRPVEDDELDAVNGGITLKPVDFFASTHKCGCGFTDFKVIEIHSDGAILTIECKRCGNHYWVGN